MAGTMGFMTLTMGFMLYQSQSRMSARQEDVNEAQLTIDYTVNLIRTLAVSAGGGLPQMANGLRRQGSNRGFVTYYNPDDAVSAVQEDLNTDTADGLLPVADPSVFAGVGYAFVTRNEEFVLSRLLPGAGTGRIKVEASAEQGLGGADFAYPVEYCSLFVDNQGFLRKTFVGRTSEDDRNIPLAAGIDSLQISYDLGSAGNGSFSTSVNDSSRVSRVKVYLRVKGAHTLSGSAKRNYETIVGIRRGRLYNRAI